MPTIKPGHRAYEMCETVTGPEFLQGWLPELTRVYNQFFAESTISAEERLANPAVTITVTDDPVGKSWYWLFVCYIPPEATATPTKGKKKKQKQKTAAPLVCVPVFLLIDGPAEKSTLLRDMPGAHLPPPIDLDSQMEALQTKAEEGKVSAHEFEAAALYDACKKVWAERGDAEAASPAVVSTEQRATRSCGGDGSNVNDSNGGHSAPAPDVVAE